MALTTAQIQQAYVTFFSRPADAAGLNYWSSYAGSVADLYATFAQQAEYTAAFNGLSSAQKVNAVYQNLFGRDAEPTGLLYWAKALDAGSVTVANLALAVSAGSQGADSSIVSNRVTAATAFTTALDTTAKILGYSGTAANASAKAWLSTVTDTAASLTAATAGVATAVTNTISVGGAAGSTFTLTTGVDTIVGTSGSDTINTTTANLNSFDSISGGAGVDTLNIDDTATGALASFTGVTLSGIEKITLNSKLGLLGAALDTSVAKFSGLTDLNVSLAAAAAAQTVTAATTTGLIISSPAAFAVTVVGGGKTADVTGGAAAVTIGQNTAPAATDANAYTSVSAKNTGANNISITDNSGAAGAIGSTMTSVTVASTGGATALQGKGIVNVTLQDTSGNVTLTNANTAAHALNLTLKGVTAGTVSDASGNATSAAITTAATTAAATGNTITLSGAKLAALTIDGSKSLTLTSAIDKLATVVITGAGGVSSDFSDDGATTTAGYVTSVDTTGSTAALSATNGTIANAITIGTSTSYAGGAGVDNVTVGASTKAIALGAGDDSLTLTAALGTGATVDGGDGTDTLTVTLAIAEAIAASSTINDKLTSIEKLDIAAPTFTASNTIELGYMAKVNNYLKIGAAAGAFTETFNNVASGGTVELYGNNAATGIAIGVKDAAFGSADSLTLALSATASGVRAGGAVTVANTETINIVTSMTAATYANNLDTLALTAAAAKTINVSGNQGLNLTAATGTAVTKIDASGLTGTDNAFTVTTGALVAATVAVPSATIIGTSTGVNTIVATNSLKPVNISVGGTANKAANVLTGSALGETIAGGAGDDTITSGGGLDTLTGNGGSDTFAIVDGSGTASSPVVITDFVRTATAGTNDKLSLTGNEAVGADAIAGWTVTSGVYTKAGASLADFYAAAAANFTALATGVFESGGNTYVFYEGATTAGTDDVFIQLTGVTGITSLHATTAGANVLVI